MSTTGSGTINLSAALQSILAADLADTASILTNTASTLKPTVRNAVATAIVSTSTPTIELAQAAASEAVAPALTKIVSDAGPEVGPLVSILANTYLSAAIPNFFNYLVGHAFGSATEQQAENTETAAGLPN